MENSSPPSATNAALDQRMSALEQVVAGMQARLISAEGNIDTLMVANAKPVSDSGGAGHDPDVN